MMSEGPPIEVTETLDLDSCWEETQPPFRLVINGKGGTPIFTATLREPLWHEWQRALRGAQLDNPVDVNTRLIVLCVTEWSADVPVTDDNVLRLHPAIQAKLKEQVERVLEVKAAQIKNFTPPLTRNGMEVNAAMAAP